MSESPETKMREGYSFQYKDGRRYQNEEAVSYVLPNDYDDLDRIHQQHWAIKVAFQCNFHSPVEDLLQEGITVLDSGCGPGTWTLDMAESYPNSKFCGVDASSVFPENIKPKNVELTVANLAKSIPYPDNTFDFIYQRLLILGLTSEDWDNTLKELFRVLKPGGYIEFVEMDIQDFPNIGPLLGKVQQKISAMLLARKMSPKILFELKDRITNAGFNHEKFELLTYKLNDGSQLSRLGWEDYTNVMLGLRPIMAESTPEWKDHEYFVDYVKQCDIECKEYGTEVNFGYHYARKPEN